MVLPLFDEEGRIGYKYMSARKKPRRACKEYERQWTSFCVDENLEDEWLVRLNALKSFRLISICEGHSNLRAIFPHINLRLERELHSGIARHWDKVRTAVGNLVVGALQATDTYVDCELKFRIKSGSAGTSYREDLTIKMRSLRPRVSPEMDSDTRRWFQQCIAQIEKVDRFVELLDLDPVRDT